MVSLGLVDHFTALVKDRPEQAAVIFTSFSGDEDRPESISYSQLDSTAKSMAVWLRSRFEPGDRVLLLYPTGLEFVRSLWGCLYAGLVPVPAPVPDSSKHHLVRATGIALDSAARVVLTDARSLTAVSAWITQDGLEHLSCVATDMVEFGDAVVWVRPGAVGPDTLALLSYTSGSTSDAKGVMLTHGNLLHNLQLIQRTFGLTEADRFFSWLPLFQDVGLIGLLLTPLYLGSVVVMMPPGDFIERPHRWLELIGRHDIHFSSAPSCAYDLCVSRISDDQIERLDLSQWRHACCNDADPVDPGALDRFVARFAPAGFRRAALRVSYGMTETTLIVAGSEPDREPVVERFDARSLSRGVLAPALPDEPARSLVSSGPVSGLELRIVDPQTTEVLADGRLGEVWIRGNSVARGYWRKEVETEYTFTAVTAKGEAGFLRTGELGGLRSGQLYIFGRIDEVIVVHGYQLYPPDIESEIRSFDDSFVGLAGSVFTVPASQPQVVVLHELRRYPGAGSPAAVADGVCQLLDRRFGLRVENVVFVASGKVRKMISGKVNRPLMRELFIADALDPLYERLGVEVRRRYRSARL